MNKFSFRDLVPGSAETGPRFGRSRNANEELARILGGIGAPPDSPPLSEHVEALSQAAVLEWNS